MKNILKETSAKLLALSAILLTLAGPAHAAKCALWITGTSTLHPYSSTATQVDVSIKFQDPASKTDRIRDLVLAGKAKELSVVIPVNLMKSESGQMDKNMYSSLKVKEFPAITFALEKYQAASEKDGVSVKLKGKLKIAGVEKEVDLESSGRMKDEILVLEGAKDILMTDYGIKPPTLMFGAIKVDDKVTVHYRMQIGAEEKQ